MFILRIPFQHLRCNITSFEDKLGNRSTSTFTQIKLSIRMTIQYCKLHRTTLTPCVLFVKSLLIRERNRYWVSLFAAQGVLRTRLQFAVCVGGP